MIDLVFFLTICEEIFDRDSTTSLFVQYVLKIIHNISHPH